MTREVLRHALLSNSLIRYFGNVLPDNNFSVTSSHRNKWKLLVWAADFNLHNKIYSLQQKKLLLKQMMRFCNESVSKIFFWHLNNGCAKQACGGSWASSPRDVQFNVKIVAWIIFQVKMPFLSCTCFFHQGNFHLLFKDRRRTIWFHATSMVPVANSMFNLQSWS